MHKLIHQLTTIKHGYGLGTMVFFLCLTIATIPTNAANNKKPGRWQGQEYTRIEHNYEIPDITLRDRDDQEVPLQSLFAEHRPVVLQFIFTSCQSICPLLTSIAAQAQEDLREVDSSTRIISISIDPEHDTPQRLKVYAERFEAEGDWYFLTGDRNDISQMLSAFDATLEGGNKMNHKPYTYMRAAGAPQWVRLTGLGGANKLVEEYRNVLE